MQFCLPTAARTLKNYTTKIQCIAMQIFKKSMKYKIIYTICLYFLIIKTS